MGFEFCYTVRRLLFGTLQPSYGRFCVDLYGRGYSDAPKTCYDAGLYTTQLALLMQHIKWDKAHIAGLSMVIRTCINYVS